MKHVGEGAWGLGGGVVVAQGVGIGSDWASSLGLQDVWDTGTVCGFLNALRNVERKKAQLVKCLPHWM